MEEDSFGGFMPLINQVHIGQESPMINTNGELVSCHVLKIETKEGTEYIFSVSNYDLMRISFLINKIIIEQYNEQK